MNRRMRKASESDARWLVEQSRAMRRTIYRKPLPVDIPYIPLGNSLIDCPACGETTICLCCICPGSLQRQVDCHVWDGFNRNVDEQGRSGPPTPEPTVYLD